MKPSSSIPRQPLTTSPQTGATATMDDTVYTMDDSRVLMGGLVTLSEDIKSVIVPETSKTTIFSSTSKSTNLSEVPKSSTTINR